MAKYFKYHSTTELEAENARLGIELRFQDDFSPLNQPLVVGTRTLGNRWCIHPMEGCDGNPDGTPGELTFRRYERFGAGGAKLIWGEACAVSMDARANPRQIALSTQTAPHFAEMVKRTKAAHRQTMGTDDDFLFGIQLTHSGRYSYPDPIIATDDPLLYGRYKVTAQTPIVTDEFLDVLPDQYAAAAKLASDVGFDFVDVKQCHRYLLSELLGAHNRPGRYGGSFENRTRATRQIFQAIQAVVPKHVLLATRMNAFDAIPFVQGTDGQGTPVPHTLPVANGWGFEPNEPLVPNLAEPIRWVQEMRLLGVSLVNIALGNPYAQPHFGRPFEYPPPDGYESPEHPLIGVNRHFQCAAAIQAANPGLAVVGTGYSYLQAFFPHAAAANVASGRIAIAGLGRLALAQPDWVRQLAEHGTLDRKRICRTFSYCTAIMRAKDHPLGQYPTGCPPFDKDAYGQIWQDVQTLQKRAKAATTSLPNS